MGLGVRATCSYCPLQLYNVYRDPRPERDIPSRNFRSPLAKVAVAGPSPVTRSTGKRPAAGPRPGSLVRPPAHEAHWLRAVGRNCNRPVYRTLTSVTSYGNIRGMNVQALKAFRANVKAILARRGLSLRDAAEAAGMGYPYLHSILSGKSNPSLMVAEKLANSLGVPLAELIQDKIPQPT